MGNGSVYGQILNQSREILPVERNFKEPLWFTQLLPHTLVCTHTLQKLQRCFRTAERHKRYALRPQQFTQKISKFRNTAKAIRCTPSKTRRGRLSPTNAVSNQRSNIRSFSAPSLPANAKTQPNHAVQKNKRPRNRDFLQAALAANTLLPTAKLALPLPKQMIGSSLIKWHHRWTTIACESNSEFGAPMFEPDVFRKQINCIEKSACDIVVTFRHPRSHSAPP